MRRVSAGLVFVGLVVASMMTLAVGCTQEPSFEPEPVPAPEPTEENGYGSDYDDDAGEDAGDGATDSGRRDAGRDAGRDGDATVRDADAGRDAIVDVRPPPRDVLQPDQIAPGDTCQVDQVSQARTCGLCGYQERVCDSDGDGGLKWRPWGFCKNEPLGACIPGTTRTEPCGLCGTQVVRCGQDCTWGQPSACTGEPRNACIPGTRDFELGLSCPVGPFGLVRVCEATCQWGRYSQDCWRNDAMTISANVNETVHAYYALSTSQKLPRLYGACPSAGVDRTETPYVHVEIKNPTALTAKVSFWHEEARLAGVPTPPPTTDTVMAAYTRATPPVTDADRRACAKGVNDSCFSSPCGSSAGSGLVATDAITVPPMGSAIVYVAAYSTTVQGKILLHARTDSLR